MSQHLTHGNIFLCNRELEQLKLLTKNNPVIYAQNVNKNSMRMLKTIHEWMNMDKKEKLLGTFQIQPKCNMGNSNFLSVGVKANVKGLLK